MAFFISLLTFLVVVLLVRSILQPWAVGSYRRIEEYLRVSPAAGAARRANVPGFSERMLTPLLRKLGAALMGITPAANLDKIRAKLDMAGNPRYFGVIEYLGAKALSLALVMPLGLLGLRQAPFSGIMAWVAVGLVVGVGLWLPDIVLQRIIEARQMAIRRALSHILDLLVVSVEAGIGFDGAMQKVVERSNGPLEREMARVLEQVRLGKPRAAALQEMGRRTDVPDLMSFVAAVTQAEVMGISIAKVLRVQAGLARERRTQRARQLAAQLPVKLLFPLVFCIFPSLFVVILGPGVVRFAELFKGLTH